MSVLISTHCCDALILDSAVCLAAVHWHIWGMQVLQQHVHAMRQICTSDTCGKAQTRRIPACNVIAGLAASWRLLCLPFDWYLPHKSINKPAFVPLVNIQSRITANESVCDACRSRTFHIWMGCALPAGIAHVGAFEGVTQFHWQKSLVEKLALLPIACCGFVASCSFGCLSHGSVAVTMLPCSECPGLS